MARSPRPTDFPERTLAAPLSNAEVMRRLFTLTWHYRAGCIRALLLQLVLLSMGMAGLALTGIGIDTLRGVATGRPVPNPLGRLHVGLPGQRSPMGFLAILAGLVLVLAMLRAVLSYAYAIQVNRLVEKRLAVDLRGAVFDKLQRLSFRFFDGNTTGSIITRVTSDVQSVRLFVEQVLIQGIIMVVSLAVYVAYMARLSASLALACLATTPFLVALAAYFSHRIQPEYLLQRTLVDRMVHRLTEALRGIAVIKAFGGEARSRAAFDEANDKVFRQQFGIFWKVSVFTPAVGVLTRINTIVLLCYGGWLVIHRGFPLGAGLVVFAGLLDQFSGQVNNVATIVNTVQQSVVGARRVFEILDAPLEVSNRPDALRRPRLSGHVRFEGVSFDYGEGETVLKDIDLEVRPGECVAILGATGAGKSLLMSLLPRFYDVRKGRITIDGSDVRDLNLEDLRRNIGIVFQESFLFSDTVAANIAFGHPEASRDQIEKAARIAAADGFVRALPRGYDTVLGEGGSGLSGGQRQRLAIARAILMEPAILLLDDPTAAVDAGTEHEILGALDRAIEGRTTFIVAHRISTLRRADFVIVMQEGRIVQKGTHEELMRLPGPYLHVANLQWVDSRDLEILAAGGRWP
jgi:ATP-binding cassette subfamily B protein